MAESQRSVSPVILIVGGVAIVAAALYALWAFVLSGNSTPTAGASAVPSAVPTVATGESAAPATEGQGGVEAGGAEGDATPSPEEGAEAIAEGESGESSQVLPETFEVYTARNPFEQLIRPREEGAASTGGVSSGFPGGSSSGSGSGVTPGTGAIGAPRPAAPGSNPTPDTGASAVPAPGATPGATTGTTPAASAGGTSTSAGTGAGGQIEVGATRVRLQSVQGGNKAVVTVNGVDYNPTVGEQFAQRFKLLSVNTNNGKECATLLFGDSRFSMCAGQTIDK